MRREPFVVAAGVLAVVPAETLLSREVLRRHPAATLVVAVRGRHLGCALSVSLLVVKAQPMPAVELHYTGQTWPHFRGLPRLTVDTLFLARLVGLNTLFLARLVASLLPERVESCTAHSRDSSDQTLSMLNKVGSARPNFFAAVGPKMDFFFFFCKYIFFSSSVIFLI